MFVLLPRRNAQHLDIRFGLIIECFHALSLEREHASAVAIQEAPFRLRFGLGFRLGLGFGLRFTLGLGFRLGFGFGLGLRFRLGFGLGSPRTA